MGFKDFKKKIANFFENFKINNVNNFYNRNKKIYVQYVNDKFIEDRDFEKYKREQEQQQKKLDKEERFNILIKIYKNYLKYKKNKEFITIIKNFLIQNRDLKYFEYLVCPSRKIDKNGIKFDLLYYPKEFTSTDIEEYSELYNLINLLDKSRYNVSEFSLANRAMYFAELYEESEFIETLKNDENWTKTENIAFYFTYNNKSNFSYEYFFEFFNEAKKLNLLFDAVEEYNNNNSKDAFYLSKDAFCLLMFKVSIDLRNEYFKNRLDEYGLKNKIVKFNSKSDEVLYEYLYDRGSSKDKIIEFIYLRNFHYTPENYSNYNESIKVINFDINCFYESLKKMKYVKSLLNEGERSLKVSINEIDIMSGYDFEKFISKLFQKMGFNTYLTKESNDQGVDVIAKKDNITIAIQTKCYSQPVGNHAIMEVVAGMKYYEADKSMVITNSTFTKSAMELAKKNNVQLWDRKALIEKINEVM